MSKTDKPRDEEKPVKDHYNPVNMKGKKIGIAGSQEPEIKPSADEYNPVNMAGKKAVPRKRVTYQIAVTTLRREKSGAPTCLKVNCFNVRPTRSLGRPSVDMMMTFIVSASAV